jgi:hypothetical protein
MTFEYHQEFVPIQQMDKIGHVCNAAAQDGWQLKSLLGPIAVASSPLAGAAMTGVFTILFERPKEAPISNGAIRGVSRIQHDGK